MTADLLVLPGVGAFGVAADAMQNSQAYLSAALIDGLPCLGICLGMQLLFDESEESPGKGVGFIPGNVTRLRTAKVPHMGWNEVEWRGSPNAEGREIDNAKTAPKLESAYFANAYICEPKDESRVLAWTTHENSTFASVVRRANTVCVQFHPEKSSRTGRAFLNALIEDLIECR